GKINNPDLCLVFMNPTARNVASDKNWTGLKAPWIGTKNVWKMFYALGFIDENFFLEIQRKKPVDWDCEFSERVYRKIKERGIYITNLSKATQIDARPLKDEVFRNYLDLFIKEMEIVKPKIIVTFGNQVSSVLLNKNIKVSEYRKKHEIFGENQLRVFPVYYPVGQGMRNMSMAKEDIDWIVDNFRK
ncbi:MAG: hypothetical protein OQK82_09220, partial [Candidatus Pacearchaeota archaeon]|nr:hypothetical protein [Candidatus Pacearchaeota archaeon]